MCREILFELLHHLGLCCGEVPAFEGIGFVVVKFINRLVRGRSDGLPFHQTMTLGANGTAEKITARINMDGMIAPGCGGSG